MSLLAIDQGTTSTRAILYGEGVPPRLILSVDHAQRYPQPGWVEHDPIELLRNIQACLEAADGIGVEAIGLANQGESCLAWNGETGEPVSPVIVWQDDRTSAWMDRLKAEGAEAMSLVRSGLPLDPYFSASKLAWILQTLPEAATLAAQGRLRLGTTDAFFRDRLTGRFETDVATASRTGLMALDDCVWDAEMCALFGVPLSCLPQIGPTAGDLGVLKGPKGMNARLTASIVDQQAALYGHGCRDLGDAKITFGTGAFALAITGSARPETSDGLLPTIAWQFAGKAPAYALEGGVYTVAAAVNWARSVGLFDAFQEISTFEGPPAIDRGLVFVPALAGLACPHWDRNARASWLGLSLDTSKAEMVRAILEGIGFRSAEVLNSMAHLLDRDLCVSVDGGLTGNSAFIQFFADALRHDVSVSAEPELTAAGVATMAAEAAGITPPQPPHRQPVSARPLPDVYTARFQAAVEAVKAFGAMHRLSDQSER